MTRTLPPAPRSSDVVPLVEVARSSRVESLHLGAIAVVDADGDLIASAGSPALQSFLRSTAKPFQLLPLLESGGVDRWAIGERELAVLTASHTGAPPHVEAVRSVLGKLGLDEGALQCGAHEPIDARAAARLRAAGDVAGPLHNNCSGNHVAMLAQAVDRGLELESYLSPRHPVQHSILQTLAEMADVEPASIGIGVDHCSAPSFAMPLRACALAYARLARPAKSSPRRGEASRRLLDAMANHPGMVGGAGRLDTDLTEVTGGRLIGKAGAEGYLGVAVRGRGWGIALKIIDGNGSRALGPAAVEMLSQLGLLTRDELQALRAHHGWRLRNHAGLDVGAVRACLEELSQHR